jgi:transcriptional regulator with XRE-family HTH domain
MSYFWDIAQAHMDAYGVRAAALARRMGTSPQTLDSWKNRGLKKLPERRLLEALARETQTPYGEVLTAVLRDIGYLPSGRDDDGRKPLWPRPV